VTLSFWYTLLEYATTLVFLIDNHTDLELVNIIMSVILILLLLLMPAWWQVVLRYMWRCNAVFRSLFETVAYPGIWIHLQRFLYFAYLLYVCVAPRGQWLEGSYSALIENLP
jgi:hypothetical protein